MLMILFIATMVAISFYTILYRIFPKSAFSKILGNKFGRFVADASMFALTTWFMVALAGSSMFSMSVGATAGVICSAFISTHAFILKNEIQGPFHFAQESSKAVISAFTPTPTPKKTPNSPLSKSEPAVTTAKTSTNPAPPTRGERGNIRTVPEGFVPDPATA